MARQLDANFFKRPLVLAENRVWRIYSGGKLIENFRYDEEGEDNDFPEDWVGSMTRANNPGREDLRDEGMTFITLPTLEEASLQSLIAQYSRYILGDTHLNRVGPDVSILVKLLDAAERLPVQVHPDRRFAKERLDSNWGKSEAWLVLDVRKDLPEPAHIYLGFNAKANEAAFRKNIEQQNVAGLLEALNKIYVKKGEVYMVDPGIPHAIGAGVFLIEIQEPTDFTISLEMTCGDIELTEEESFLGLGMEKAIEAIDFHGERDEDLINQQRITPEIVRQENACQGEELIGPNETSCFSMERWTVSGSIDKSDPEMFRIVTVIGGAGEFRFDGGKLRVAKGETLLLPAIFQEYELAATDPEKPLKMVYCMPPKMR